MNALRPTVLRSIAKASRRSMATVNPTKAHNVAFPVSHPNLNRKGAMELIVDNNLRLSYNFFFLF